MPSRRESGCATVGSLLVAGPPTRPVPPGGGFMLPDQPVNRRTAAQRGGKRRELQSQYQGVRDDVIGGAGVIGIEVCPREPLTGGVLHLWFGDEGHGFDAEPGDQLLQAPGMVQRVWRSGGARAFCGHLRRSSKSTSCTRLARDFPPLDTPTHLSTKIPAPNAPRLPRHLVERMLVLEDLDLSSLQPSLVYSDEGNPRLGYPSDLTDEDWWHIVPLIPPVKHGGHKASLLGSSRSPPRSCPGSPPRDEWRVAISPTAPEISNPNF